MGEKENKIKLARIIASTILLVVASLLNRAFDVPMRVQLLLFLPAYLVAGYDVLAEAGESIVRREAFDEDFLMSVATLGALLIGFVPGGEPEFAEAVFVMLFFQVGELFEDLAQDKSRASISELMDIRPDTANVERDGHALTIEYYSASRDTLQEVIAFLKGQDYGQPLQYVNYR